MDSRPLIVRHGESVLRRIDLGKRSRSFGLSFILIEAHRLQFGKHGADKNLRFDAKWNAISIVRNPDRRAPEFAMRFQFKVLTDTLELKIDFDRIVCSRTNGYSLVSQDGDCRQISRSRGINNDVINAAVVEVLAALVKEGAVQVEETV